MRSLRIAALLMLIAQPAWAFCGFYVGGADTKLFNNATQVALMRDGNRTVLSMQNNYQGPPEKFAMVVPVPVILQKENVKTLPKDVFDRLDQLTAPRLVEYWEQDPCAQDKQAKAESAAGAAKPAAASLGIGSGAAKDLGVTVEAQFAVGEYEIVILSAKDSGGLEEWLHQESYEIPKGAEPYFRPYVAAGSKFFVAKVDPSKVTFTNGQADLSPLRFHYDTPDFNLPVRLGLINSAGTQDLIVQILAENKRYEPANYPSVTIPTNLDVAEASKEQFGAFYAALFDRTIEKNPKAIVTEYSWAASSCDPCPGPALNPQDLATLGADALADDGKRAAQVVLDQPPTLARVNENALVPARLAGRVRMCWQQFVDKDPKTSDTQLDVKIDYGPDGRVKTVTPVKNDLSADAMACMKTALEAGVFPVSDKGGTMHAVYKLSSRPMTRYRNFTITRLHARYSKDALGADIVFKEAPAIVGGREVLGKDGALEHGASPSSYNNFQARYAIRHPWTGEIACKDPKRNVWGGPPNGSYTGPTPAKKLASASRGGVDLAKLVKSDVGELGLKADVPPAPAQKKGCGCEATPVDPGAAAGLLAVVGVVARMLRRRR